MTQQNTEWFKHASFLRRITIPVTYTLMHMVPGFITLGTEEMKWVNDWINMPTIMISIINMNRRIWEIAHNIWGSAYPFVHADCWICLRSLDAASVSGASWWGKRPQRWKRSSLSQCRSLLHLCTWCEDKVASNCPFHSVTVWHTLFNLPQNILIFSSHALKNYSFPTLNLNFTTSLLQSYSLL